MEENNVMTGAGEQFGGHPTQAHEDHATIMKAHEIIGTPHRMAAVQSLHAQGGGLINYLKKKQKDFATKEAQMNAAANPQAPAHEEAPEADKDSDMRPNPVASAGSKKSAEVE